MKRLNDKEFRTKLLEEMDKCIQHVENKYKKDPSFFLENDIPDIKAIRALIRVKKYEDAANSINELDTDVRDYIPTFVYKNLCEDETDD